MISGTFITELCLELASPKEVTAREACQALLTVAATLPEPTRRLLAHRLTKLAYALAVQTGLETGEG